MNKQTPWFDRTFGFDLPVGLFPVIFSRLEGTIFRLEKILATADDTVGVVSTGSWSAKEHVGHLYDLEDLWWKRLGNFINHDPLLAIADLDNVKTREANHNAKTFEELLLQFTLERQRMLESIFSFDEEMLERTSVHPRLNQAMRMVDYLHFIAEHDDHHVAIISTLLR